ncbi:uncharacterized protein [Henckelia pumila]|uniref:uncharacterized protein n=1 Tax=Henckelia pumila TaxID=405737 RepID=UPI003C6E546A
MYPHAANWTFYFDIDEYIYLPNGNTLESVMRAPPSSPSSKTPCQCPLLERFLQLLQMNKLFLLEQSKVASSCDPFYRKINQVAEFWRLSWILAIVAIILTICTWILLILGSVTALLRWPTAPAGEMKEVRSLAAKPNGVIHVVKTAWLEDCTHKKKGNRNP